MGFVMIVCMLCRFVEGDLRLASLAKQLLVADHIEVRAINNPLRLIG